MNFSHFFIRRPIFAGVLSIVIFLVGADLACCGCRSANIPEVVPPTVVVRATYPGANPKTIAETVAAPLEQAINGVENSLYMFSQATGDGVMTLTVTFKLGTDLDKAQVQVQNRVVAGAAEAARGSPPPRRHHDQAIARPDDGRAPVLAGRPLRRRLRAQLRHAAGEGRARAHSRRRARCRSSAPATTRCASGSIPNKVAARKPDRERCRRRDPRAECPGRRRRRRPAAASARPVDTRAADQRQGPARSTEEEFGADHRQDRRRTARRRLLKDVARIELGAGELRAALAAEQQDRGRAADLPAARRQRHRNSPTTCARRWRS